MLKRAVEYGIRTLRNPRYTFHPSVTGSMIASLAWTSAVSLLRGIVATALRGKPRPVFLGRGVRFVNLPRVRFGRGVRLGDHVLVSAVGNEVVFGDNSSIGA